MSHVQAHVQRYNRRIQMLDQGATHTASLSLLW